jgi:tetratricopeptide (TPR) repeat protein
MLKSISTRKISNLFLRSLIVLFVTLIISCKNKTAGPSQAQINEIDLKRGEVISCGPGDLKLGTVAFELTGSEKIKPDFNLAIKLLHSFEYDEAEKMFAKVIDEEPACAMAYWGVAMSNFHALWTPPSEAELKKGSKAIEIAKSVTQKTQRETDYINAIAAFYNQWDKVDHLTRCINFEKGMESVYTKYPDDKEAAIFYALALNAAADPADKSFSKQKKAGSILTSLYPGQPEHPGIVHYIIHTYDSPELAHLALEAARKYASVAPSSAHALHMPSHIFTRLGLWDEDIASNLASVSSAQCYAKAAGIKGHWDEEFHGIDYLVYAYLQQGENDKAKTQLEYMSTINEINPPNFKVAYAFAASPSRYLLENKLWQEAAELQANHANIAWQNFPWQKAIIHFTRLLGSVNINNIGKAQLELQELKVLHDKLIGLKDTYKANQVQIQIKTGEAWIQFKEGNTGEALKIMNMAADMEDKTEKHPVTPGEVIPAREFLGDMLLQMNNPVNSLEAYEADLLKHPNRFNALYGAGLSAEKSANHEKAKRYYTQLLNITVPQSNRHELASIKAYLNRN